MGAGPPGSAGVPPACTPVACRSASLRWRTRPRCRQEPHGPDRSRALASLPVEPGRADGPRCARNCAGGTPALPGGLHPVTSSQPRRSRSSLPCGLSCASFASVFNQEFFSMDLLRLGPYRWGQGFLDIAQSIPYSWPSFGGCVRLAAPVHIRVPTLLSTLGWLPAPPQPCPTASPSCSIRNAVWWF